jgi:cytochrome d ubiquinol oxidase subunit I
VSAGELIASLVTLTAVYAVLLVVEVKLLVKYIRGGVVSAMPELAHAPADENEDETPRDQGGPGKPADDVLAFAY